MRRLVVLTLFLALACSESARDPGPMAGRDQGAPIGSARDFGALDASLPDGGGAGDMGADDFGDGSEDLGPDGGPPDGGGGEDPLGYRFVKITDSNVSDAPVGGVEPTVDGAGRVAWRTVAEGPSAQVRVGDGAGPEQILYDAATSMEPLAFINIQRPRFNERGRLVARIETTAFQDAVVSGDGGPFTLIATEGDDPTFGGFSLNFPAEIADDDQVLFVDRSAQAWVGDGSARPVAQLSDELALFGSARILAGGQVVATARLGEDREEVIVRLTGPETFEVVLSETELAEDLSLGGFLHASPDGETVAFSLRVSGNPGAEGVSVVDSNGLRTLVEPSEALTPIQFMEVNAGRTVVFISGAAGQPRQAIRRGPDPEDVVIAVGEELFGAPVTVLDFRPAGLNDAGQIAFAYCNENECGIARADPVRE